MLRQHEFFHDLSDISYVTIKKIMTRTINSTLALAVIAVLAVSAFAYTALAGQETTGNGAPSGAHYNLNIIGVSKDKTADMTGDNGHRIFVPLWGNAKINLAEGDDFQVLDANGTDRDGAAFQLPNPDPDNDGVTVYSVYARALGKPGGDATIATCATAAGDDGILGTDDDEDVCSSETLTVETANGKGKKPKFENVSRELLYIYVDLDGDGVEERYNLFADELEGYFWDYNNNGLKLLQLRFYEVETDVENL